MVAINSSDNLGFILSGIYSVLSQNHGSQTMQQSKNDSVLQFSLPFWDPISRGKQLWDSITRVNIILMMNKRTVKLLS